MLALLLLAERRDAALPLCRLTVLLVLVAGLTSCQGGEVVLHPTDDNIPVVDDSRSMLHERDMAEPWVEFTTLQGDTIGVEEGDPHEMVGIVPAQALDIGMDVVVYADFENNEVRYHGHDGALRSVVGSSGRGPGEFTMPIALDISDDGGWLVVGDRGSRVQLFRLDDSSYALEKVFFTERFANGNLCSMHGHVYTIGYSDDLDGVIHKYTLDGTYVLSFGTPYEATEWIVRNWISRTGQLECNAAHRVIGYVNRYFPLLTGFSETGDMVWRVRFADVQLVSAEESRTDDGRPSIRNAAPQIGDAEGIALLTTPGDTDAFVATYYTYGPDRTSKHHLFSVDIPSGQGTYLGWYAGWHEGGQIRTPNLVALDAGYLYTVNYEPYPHIGIYQRPGL